jgi:hypothetical protein
VVRRWLVAVAVGAALAASVRGSSGVAPAAAAVQHHAAVVVDTGTSVKKVCVAFPEDSISGEEALRRADAVERLDPVFSDRYGSKGLAVCSLCGVGCGDPSDCFCDSAHYWAYHRAAPGDGSYTFSSRGASTTVVRDGDVEGWKWGKGEPPELTTVGKVCNVDEPPARPSSGGSTATTGPPAPATTAPPEPTTTAAPVASGARPAPANSAPAASGSGNTGPATDAGTVGAGDLATAATPDDLAAGAEPTGDTTPTAAARPRVPADKPGRGPSPIALALFVVLLAGLLGWRWRLRQAHA